MRAGLARVAEPIVVPVGLRDDDALAMRRTPSEASALRVAAGLEVPFMSWNCLRLTYGKSTRKRFACPRRIHMTTHMAAHTNGGSRDSIVSRLRWAPGIHAPYAEAEPGT